MLHRKIKIIVSNKKQFGFTIVEVLIVIIVIGILATLTLFAGAGYIKNSAETAMKTDLSSSLTKLDSIESTTSEYPSTLPAEIKSTNGAVFTYTSSGTAFCLNATHPRYSTMKYHVTNDIKEPKAGEC